MTRVDRLDDAVPGAGRRRLPAGRRRARPRHGDGRLPHRGGAADRGRREAAPPAPARAPALGVVVLLAIAIEPYRMARLTGLPRPRLGSRAAPASRRSRRRSRSAPAGSSASGSGRACRRPSTCPRPTRT